MREFVIESAFATRSITQNNRIRISVAVDQRASCPELSQRDTRSSTSRLVMKFRTGFARFIEFHFKTNLRLIPRLVGRLSCSKIARLLKEHAPIVFVIFAFKE